MNDDKRRIAAAKLEEEQRQTNEAIGAFIFEFSQLEFTIRARLARVLGLKDSMADIVIGPYDFAMLCVVSRESMLAKKRVSKKRKKAVEAFFKDCLTLNSQNRLIVAHALWTIGGASHISRSSLKRKIHFSDLDDLRAETGKAHQLMMRMFRDRI
ncbi:hypothetical protein G8O24_41615 [Bradyrhizobium sp. INPA01-394B]|uniref:Uncharacterized protein n=1 Tax=Bradyrhizobium campsiandrae TaxID=1729892 RepID=A0ABR7ULT3_9BRAD|nr:hypothetical protein [Bradyrhizobium campsiandrae]MBC9883776.1 hypothetical protein [Bradyrhizobium campsiandrae]MBC9984556.1 hypothetical protein [Bradyrhizobium campsiandrae]